MIYLFSFFIWPGGVGANLGSYPLKPNWAIWSCDLYPLTGLKPLSPLLQIKALRMWMIFDVSRLG